MTLRQWLVRALRRWAVALGGESDEELRARVLAMYARSNLCGSRESVERAISSVMPYGMALQFIWDGPVCRGDATRLTVVMR